MFSVLTDHILIHFTFYDEESFKYLSVFLYFEIHSVTSDFNSLCEIILQRSKAKIKVVFKESTFLLTELYTIYPLDTIFRVITEKLSKIKVNGGKRF